MAGISHCTACGRGLRAVAIFCPGCGFACCCWSCYVRHQPQCSGGMDVLLPTGKEKATPGLAEAWNKRSYSV